MSLPCPECEREMIVKPLKGGGFHFLCYGRDPVEHRVTIFWKRPSEAPLRNGEVDDLPARTSSRESVSASPVSQVSSRVSSLLARAEKLTQRRVGE